MTIISILMYIYNTLCIRNINNDDDDVTNIFSLFTIIKEYLIQSNNNYRHKKSRYKVSYVIEWVTVLSGVVQSFTKNKQHWYIVVYEYKNNDSEKHFNVLKAQKIENWKILYFTRKLFEIVRYYYHVCILAILIKC